MTALDASAFPHILDEIISAAPPASLIALRPVSQSLHTRANTLLFAHIVVTSAPSPAPSFLSGPAQQILTTPCGARLPTPPLPSQTTACASLNSTLRPLLRHTHTATLRSLTLAAANTLAPLLPNLHTVHRYTPQPWDSPLLKATTYIDHIDLSRRAIAGCLPLGDVPSDLTTLVLRLSLRTAEYPPRALLQLHPGGGGPPSFPVLDEMDPPHIPAVVVVADPIGAKWPRDETWTVMWTGTIARRLARARPRALTLVAFDELGDAAPSARVGHEDGYDGGNMGESWPKGCDSASRMDPMTRAAHIESAEWGFTRARVDMPRLAVLSRAEWEAGAGVDMGAGMDACAR